MCNNINTSSSPLIIFRSTHMVTCPHSDFVTRLNCSLHLIYLCVILALSLYQESKKNLKCKFIGIIDFLPLYESGINREYLGEPWGHGTPQ